MSHHLLRGRILFGEAYTYRELAALAVAGAAVKATAITEAFNFEDFQRHNPSAVVPLFMKSERSEIAVVTAETKLQPGAGQTIIALIHSTARVPAPSDAATAMTAESESPRGGARLES